MVDLHIDQLSYIPQVIISRSFSNQVVNVHIMGLADTVNTVFCLNENLQVKKGKHPDDHLCNLRTQGPDWKKNERVNAKSC